MGTKSLRENPKFNAFIAEFTNLARMGENLSLNDSRKLGADFFLQDAVIDPVEKIENIEIPARDSHNIPVRLYIPSTDKKLPLMIYFHRGGFVFGSIREADPVCRKLANQFNCIVASVGYRLAPENPFPKPLNDAYDATEWLSKNGAPFGADLSKLLICGESAGGNLAAAVTLLARDKTGPKISLQLLIYPVIRANTPDMAYEKSEDKYFLTKDTMNFFWSMYLQTPGDDKKPYSSLEFASNLEGLPPAIIITADYDPLRYDGKEYADRLKDAGNEVIYKNFSEVIHGFIDMPIYTEEEKIEWIKEIKKLIEPKL